MNQNHQTPQPAPQPLCATFEPLLPLLSLSQLDEEQAAEAQAHVATCAFCQRRTSEYDFLRDALRRNAVLDDEPAQAMPAFSLEAILRAAEKDHDGVFDDAPHASAPTVATAGGARSGSRFAPNAPRRARGRWSAVGALAAVLLLGVLAATILGRPGRQFGGTLIAGVGTLAAFSLSAHGQQPRSIIAGPDGNLWFTENGGIGRITSGGIVTEFPLPGGATPLGLAAGPDGAIWVTYATDVAGKIGRVDPHDGHVTEFALPAGASPTGPIVAGADGALWFVLGLSGSTGSGPAASEVGRITPGGKVTAFALPLPHPPDDLAVGPDGNLWFTTWGTGHDTIGRMTLAGSVAQFPTPDFNGQPTRIAKGPDGNLWFLETSGVIGRITPLGIITEFTPPNNTDLSLEDLALGPDGNFWFTSGSQLGRLTPTGAITEFALPAGITLDHLALGPDDNLWFTSIAANSVSRLELAP